MLYFIETQPFSLLILILLPVVFAQEKEAPDKSGQLSLSSEILIPDKICLSQPQAKNLPHPFVHCFLFPAHLFLLSLGPPVMPATAFAQLLLLSCCTLSSSNFFFLKYDNLGESQITFCGLGETFDGVGC